PPKAGSRTSKAQVQRPKTQGSDFSNFRISHLKKSGLVFTSSAGAAEVFFERPIAAAAGLAGDDEVEAGDEGDELAARSGLLACIAWNTLATAAAGAVEIGGEFPTMSEDSRIELPTKLLSLDGMGR